MSGEGLWSGLLGRSELGGLWADFNRRLGGKPHRHLATLHAQKIGKQASYTKGQATQTETYDKLITHCNRMYT